MSKIFSGWLLGPSASSFGPQVDQLYNLVLLITGIAFVLSEAALIWFSFKYRAKSGQKALYSHGSVTAEAIWTAVPAAILIVLGFMGQNLWAKLRQPAKFPTPDLTIRVMGEQWLWHFKIDSPSGEIEAQNAFHVPVGKMVRFDLQSQDVIHGFYIPELRVHQDAVPGMTSSVWVQPTKTGSYEIRCTQFCGTNHYQMKGQIVVDTPEDFQAWTATTKSEAF